MMLRLVTWLNFHPRLWDIAIGTLLLLSAGTAIFFWPRSIIISLIAAICFVLVFYGSFIEPKRMVITRKNITVPNLSLFRIAVIGDIHVGPYKQKRFVEKMVERVNALNADIIFLVGDFIYNEHSQVEDIHPLQHLRAPHGIFAVMGNHDSGKDELRGVRFEFTDRTDDVCAALKICNISVLRNENVTLSLNTMTLSIAGIDDVWMESCDLQSSLKNTEGNTTILLSHNPDIIRDERSHTADLIVSGHTHGGQIRLPFIGSLAPIPNILGRTFDRGLFKVGEKTTLAVTQGIGETLARARLFCPPEILVLEILAD